MSIALCYNVICYWLPVNMCVLVSCLQLVTLSVSSNHNYSLSAMDSVGYYGYKGRNDFRLIGFQ